METGADQYGHFSRSSVMRTLYQQNCKSRKLTKNVIILVRFILRPSRNTKVDASK